MKKIFNTKFLVLISIVSASIVISCTDDVTVENRNEIQPGIFFADVSQIESATVALYSQLQTPGLYQRFGYILPDTFSDEVITSGDPNFQPSYQYSITPTMDQTTLYWRSIYIGISISNYVLDAEGIMRDNIFGSDITEEDVDNALGEAYFMRGLYYFLLVKRYGGVPLILENSSVEGTFRSTQEEVYESIISDFTNASLLLRDKFTTQKGRATKGAALAMLGKAYLFTEKYIEAQTVLSDIDGYDLLPKEDYADNFNESGEFTASNNPESMFEVLFSADNNPADTWAGNGQGIAEITFHAQEYSGWGNVRPSQKLVDEFEPDDPRKSFAILENGDSYGPANSFTNTNGRIWYKFSQLYENQSIVPEGSTNARFLRYADVLLMQAEVEHKLDNNPGAIDYLNELRIRFDLPLYGSPEMDARGYPVNTPDEVFNAIVHERMVELCGEQHRFDDLVRWGIDEQELATDDSGAPRGYVRDVHKFMPIPQIEIDTNPLLGSGSVPAQNNGY